MYRLRTELWRELMFDCGFTSLIWTMVGTVIAILALTVYVFVAVAFGVLFGFVLPMPVDGGSMLIFTALFGSAVAGAAYILGREIGYRLLTRCERLTNVDVKCEDYGNRDEELWKISISPQLVCYVGLGVGLPYEGTSHHDEFWVRVPRYNWSCAILRFLRRLKKEDSMGPI